MMVFAKSYQTIEITKNTFHALLPIAYLHFSKHHKEVSWIDK